MTASRILLYAVINVALSVGIFILALLFSAKPLYVVYADLFQLGQVYQGETHALMYNRYLFAVIAPCSLLLGSALAWLLIARRWIAFVSATLILLATLLAIALLHLEPVALQPAPLDDHPNAHWSGDVDGGAFFEIIHAEPPRYLVQIRHLSGNLWMEGWITHRAKKIRNSDFWAYDGGTDLYLKDGTQLRLENRDGTSILAE
jgi:hypothetical protein